MSTSAKRSGPTARRTGTRLTRVIAGETPAAPLEPPDSLVEQYAALAPVLQPRAVDPPHLLRRAGSRDSGVLAAPRRPPRDHRAGPAPVDPGDDVGGEAGTRPRVHRRSLGAPLPVGDRHYGLADRVPPSQPAC